MSLEPLVNCVKKAIVNIEPELQLIVSMNIDDPRFIHENLSFLKLPSDYTKKIEQSLEGKGTVIRLRIGIGHVLIRKDPKGYWVGKNKPGSTVDFDPIISEKGN